MQSLWMVAAALCFAVMGAMVKYTMGQHSAFEIVFYRGVICAILIGLWMQVKHLRFETGRMRMHASRSIIGTAAMMCWYFAIGHLPLATGMTLNYTAPVFIALIVATAPFWLRRLKGPGAVPTQRPLRHRFYLTIAAGFAGVLIILRPTVDSGATLAMAVGLASGFLSALALLQVRALGRMGEPEWRTVFYFSIVNALMGLTGALIGGFQPLDLHGMALVCLISLAALAGQLMQTRAFGRGRALLTANLQYSGIIFATVVGWIAFDERADWIEFAGMALVVASGSLATWMSARQDTVDAGPALEGATEVVSPDPGPPTRASPHSSGDSRP